jgi:hypothetical protein
MSIRRLTTSLTAIGTLLMAVVATTALSVGSAEAGSCKTAVRMVVKYGVVWGIDANGRWYKCPRQMRQ